MTIRRALILIAIAGIASQAHASEGLCKAVSDMSYICDIVNAEDLVTVPGSAWILASGYSAGGGVYAIDSRSRTFSQVYDPSNFKHDASAFPGCGSPPAAATSTDTAEAVTNVTRTTMVSSTPPTSPTEAKAERTPIGQWKKGDLIGSGAFGRVYQARRIRAGWFCSGLCTRIVIQCYHPCTGLHHTRASLSVPRWCAQPKLGCTQPHVLAPMHLAPPIWPLAFHSALTWRMGR